MSDSNVRTAEEAREKHRIAMGPELGDLYSALWQQLVSLHKKWGEYVALFGTKPERIELLNQAGPSFFRTVQDCLWRDVLIHLARITDPPRSAGKDNLTLKRLPPLISAPKKRSELEALILRSVESTAFARDWRNRQIAHHDLLLSLDLPTEPLAAASRNHVDSALAAVGEVLNFLSLHYLESTTMFEFAAKPTAGGATSMLYYLRAGIEGECARRERVMSGTHDAKDLERRSL
ncbi:MAG: hypothetical protein Q7T00_08160 [Rugosibacter sp.]|nr:hypothetical protein [Rugosibacter sp.]